MRQNLQKTAAVEFPAKLYKERNLQKIVAVNEKGRPIGESHWKARFLDTEVDLMFALYEGGMTITEIARKFETRKSTINDILKGRRRAQHAARFKTVRVTEELA